MTSDVRRLSFGLSQSFPCSYLPGEQEQLLVNRESITLSQYERLLSVGFRRSGTQVYQPHCQHCQACIPVRLPLGQFKHSTSQKRVIAKNRDLSWRISLRSTEEHQQLYLEYINQRHSDGPMFPPSQQQFESFLLCDWLECLFIEARLDGRLIMVAVTDLLPNSLSATYTFFDQKLAHRSLGTRGVLAQIELGRRMNKAHLYLGYQIDACAKMSYKKRFRPIERFEKGEWQEWLT